MDNFVKNIKELSMNILDIQEDEVVDGLIAIGFFSYEEAFQKLVPLINKTEIQRKLQPRKFYEKLERDICNGCVMPPVTVAFVTDEIDSDSSKNSILSYLDENVEKAFILDGIQRLNTLSRLSDSSDLDRDKKLYANILFCKSVEKLLYRMITLNNGQRPMTPRHQVEILMSNVYDFDELGIVVLTEKEAAERKNSSAFRKADLIQAYLAFMAEEPLIDNNKIIAEKMDQLLVGKIFAVNPSSHTLEFSALISVLAKLQKHPKAVRWLKITNNLVGLSAGVKGAIDVLKSIEPEDFIEHIEVFDDAFSSLNPSTIKVGKLRRELTQIYFKNFTKYMKLDSDQLLEVFNDLTSDD